MRAADPASGIDLAREPDFQLGGLLIRPSACRVVGVRGEQRLERKVMEVLLTLARSAGATVSREQLIEACWGGRAVSDDAVNRCISVIRRITDALGGFTVQTVARVGYQLSADGPVRGNEEDAVLPPPKEPLLAVLAFDNLSGDPEMTYFSDGVSEEIQETVARGSALKVIGKASSFQFRGADKAASNVGAALNATHILDGSVRRSGQRVRISAQLVECARSTTLWSNRFDRDLT